MPAALWTASARPTPSSKAARAAGSQASASLSLGVDSSWKSSESHSSTAVPDELSAGQGYGPGRPDQDLTMQGTQAQAGRDMTLAAGRDLDIHAAESSAGSSSDGGSFGAGVGVKATLPGPRAGPWVSTVM